MVTIAELALRDRLIATESRLALRERDRDEAFCEWLETEPGSRAWKRCVRRLQDLDEEIRILLAKQNRFRSQARGERHLQVVR